MSANTPEIESTPSHSPGDSVRTTTPTSSPLVPSPKVRSRRPRSKPSRQPCRSSPCSSPARDVASKRRKQDAIVSALKTNPIDHLTLRQLAISRGGLLNDGIRQKAWPKLLNVNVDNIAEKPERDILHGHRDYEQVVLDVNRSLKRFPPGMDEDVRLSMQDQLVDVIMWVLASNPDLHYYQGYHDVVVTFLLVLGEELTFAVMDTLSKQHLRDFLDQTMDKTNHNLNYLYPLIGKANSQLRAFMEKSEVGTIFALSWLITWYGHVLNDVRHIVRLYDFFIACHPLMPIYLAAAIVLYKQKDVLACECEMAMVHCVLSKIPDDMPFEQLISNAGDLFIQYPAADLAPEAKKHYEKSMEEQEKLNSARQEMVKRRQQQVALRERALRGRGVVVKVTLWALTAMLSAAALAVFNSKTDWHLWLWK